MTMCGYCSLFNWLNEPPYACTLSLSACGISIPFLDYCSEELTFIPMLQSLYINIQLLPPLWIVIRCWYIAQVFPCFSATSPLFTLVFSPNSEDISTHASISWIDQIIASSDRTRTEAQIDSTKTYNACLARMCKLPQDVPVPR